MDTRQPHHEHLTSGSAAARHEGQILTLGGVLAVLGGLGYFIALLFHGDLPDQTTEVALNHIAGRPEWATLKLSLIVSIAVAVLLIGATVVVVEYSILGYGVKHIADAWHPAAGSDRERHQLVAEALFGISGGLFVSFIAWLFGLPHLLMGLAIACGRVYPAWLGMGGCGRRRRRAAGGRNGVPAR